MHAERSSAPTLSPPQHLQRNGVRRTNRQAITSDLGIQFRGGSTCSTVAHLGFQCNAVSLGLLRGPAHNGHRHAVVGQRRLQLLGRAAGVGCGRGWWMGETGRGSEKKKRKKGVVQSDQGAFLPGMLLLEPSQLRLQGDSQLQLQAAIHSCSPPASSARPTCRTFGGER